jgi:daunorubicin resistance ABC transporter ATP-binding subunit
MTNAIEADGLVKTFGAEVRALDGLSLAVEEGTVFGLLGPNGAGKTTAVRIFTTTLVPDAGEARVAGYDVVRQADEARLHIGLAGQFAAVDGNLTGRENLRLIGQLCHLPRRLASTRADELLERFELTDAAGRPAKTYSGGMRRRLDVAASLVNQPPVLFFDEPTTGLDPQSRNSLWELIEELVRGGTTVLLTTQYLEEADRLADRIAVVDHGKVIAEGTPGELKARLGATVLDLVFSTEDEAVKAEALFQSSWSKPPVRDRLIVELTVENGPRQVMEALRLLDGAGLGPTGITLREPSLDDVFLTLTGRRAVVVTEEGEAQ